MCGIYGILNPNPECWQIRDLHSMGEVIKNRGPDAVGTHIEQDFWLGNRRLAINDLSANGSEPLSNENGSLWLTFNGEIYNAPKLRADLEKKHQFRSHSDAEVVLHLYEEMGSKAWHKLEGMFAFALCDREKKRHYLVRDPFGIKPLYYTQIGTSLLFASQMKALFNLPHFDKKIDEQALSNFLSYFYVPGPETIFENIYQVQPSTELCYYDGKISIKPYFDLTISSTQEVPISEWIERLQFTLRESVRDSLLSDVPLGLLLSGGMDSASLLTELSRLGKKEVPLFSLGSSEKHYDESRSAQNTAHHFNRQTQVRPFHIKQFDDQIKSAMNAVDCLNANPGILNMQQFFQFASEQVKVALGGHGGDELLAGYQTYKADAWAPLIQRVPKTVRKLSIKAAQKFPQSDKMYSIGYLGSRFLEGTFFDRMKAHYWWRVIFSDAEKARLLQISSKSSLALDSSYKYWQAFQRKEGTFEEKSLHADLQLFLTDNSLMLADHLAMDSSLEIRPPFLHPKFVKFAFSVPFSLKLHHGKTKYLLKKAYSKQLPKAILKAKKKGVVAPLGKLFRTSLRNYVSSEFAPKAWEPIAFIQPRFASHLAQQHLEGKGEHGYKLWSLLCYKKWHEAHLQ